MCVALLFVRVLGTFSKKFFCLRSLDAISIMNHFDFFQSSTRRHDAV